MTNQQAPEIYALHTVPNKGERPWSGIYAVRADAEHDAKVLRDATGRDWSVVRLVVADTATTPTGPVARYKISYATDDGGMRSSTPSGIPDHAGAWVRYEDHAAELLRLHAENEALRTQQDDAYDHGPQAETVEEASRFGSPELQAMIIARCVEKDQADRVQEDAALWHWLAEYLVGTRTDLDDEIVACETVNDLRNLVEAAIKQGATQ